MVNRELDKKLFAEENSVLQSAMEVLGDVRYQSNDLRHDYEQLVNKYDKLLRVTQRIFRISDSQGLILQRQQLELKNLLDNTRQGFLTFGSDLAVDTQYSSECLRLFRRKIGNTSIAELLGQADGANECMWTKVLKEVFRSSDQEEQRLLLLQLPQVVKIYDTDVKVEFKAITHGADESEEMLMMAILTDITEKIKAEEQILFLNYHDKLTSLYNRAYVDMIVPQLDTVENLPFSVIFVDMNGLKLTNDVFGHEQGDRLLIAAAQLLTKVCRKTDVVARWGGDEFILLLPGADGKTCREICDRIRRLCLEQEPNPIPLSAAIGAATKETPNVSIQDLFGAAENRMYSNKLLESKEVRRNILKEMEQILEKRCYETFGHMERTKQLAVSFATYLGIDQEPGDMRALETLASLHDIGNVAIPQHILGKKDPLTADEWEIVKGHSEIGYRMAQSIGEVRVADLILATHERWDGGGYPYGLKGQQIPLLTRLFALVDVFDVIRHGRPYKAAVTDSAALVEIAAAGGTQFDPDLTEQFIKFMTEGQNNL